MYKIKNIKYSNYFNIFKIYFFLKKKKNTRHFIFHNSGGENMN